MDKKINVVKDILNRLTTYRVEERICAESDSKAEELGGQDFQNSTIKEGEEKDEAAECICDSLIPPNARKLPNFEA